LEKVRKPTVAGQFYDGNKANLEQNIKEYFLDKRGPGKLPEANQEKKKIRFSR